MDHGTKQSVLTNAGSSGSGSVSTTAVANAVAMTTAEAIASAVANATGNNAQVGAQQQTARPAMLLQHVTPWPGIWLPEGSRPAAFVAGLVCLTVKMSHRRPQQPLTPATSRLPSTPPSAAPLATPRSQVLTVQHFKMSAMPRVSHNRPAPASLAYMYINATASPNNRDELASLPYYPRTGPGQASSTSAATATAVAQAVAQVLVSAFAAITASGSGDVTVRQGSGVLQDSTRAMQSRESVIRLLASNTFGTIY
jgi:hypothetical protein